MSIYAASPEYRREMDKISREQCSKIDKDPFGFCITIILQEGGEGSDIALNIKKQAEAYLQENGIKGTIFVPDISITKLWDIQFLIALSKVVLFCHITENRNPVDLPELEYWRNLCPGKKFAVVSTDLRETPSISFLRSAVDFLIKSPLDPKELIKMLKMFASSFLSKQNTEGIVIPTGEGNPQR